MSKRPLRLEQALDVLPDLPEMEALRDALLQGSHADDTQAWAGSQAYLTLDKRVANVGALWKRVPELAEEARRRAERLFTHGADALTAVEAGDFAAAARALVAAGEVEEAGLRYEEAERFYFKALELGRKPRDRRAEGLALRRLGRLERTRGRLERALQLYREGYEVAELQRDRLGAAVGCMGVGHVLVDQEHLWEEARVWYLRALELLGDEPTPELLHLCNALSVVERRLGRLEESEAWLRRGEAAAAEVRDATAESYLEHGRARLHMARGEHAEAEAVLRRMLARPLDPHARVSALVYLAEPLMALGREEEAERVVRAAEELALRSRAPRYLPVVYRTLGELARRRADAEGFIFFEQALEVIRTHELPRFELAATQHEYGRFQARVGEPEAARARLRLALETFRGIGAGPEAREVEATLQTIEPAAPDLAVNGPDGGETG